MREALREFHGVVGIRERAGSFCGGIEARKIAWLANNLNPEGLLGTAEVEDRTKAILETGMKPVMSDHTHPQRILLAGFHPLLEEDSRLHAAGAYDIVAATADETTLLPAVEQLSPDFVMLDLLYARSFRTIRRITDIKPSCRVVAVISTRRRDVADSIFQSGACGILHRSDAAAELLLAIRTVSSGRRFLSSALMKCSSRQTTGRLEPTTGLSPLDELVLHLRRRGYSANRIARVLGVSLDTIRLSLDFLKQLHRTRMGPRQNDGAMTFGRPADRR